MIRTLLLVAAMQLLSLVSNAQTPDLINYQGAARRSDGQPLKNASIALRFELRQGSPGGSTVFSENQNNISTSGLGLFATQIGKTNTSGFAAVSWENGPYFLNVAIDTANGSSFTEVGSQQLVSVPFAFNAKHAQNVPSTYSNNILTVGNFSHALAVYSGGAGISVTGTLITNTAPDQTVVISAGDNISVNGTYPNFSVASNPSLNLNGNDLSISGGNTVTVAPSLSLSGNVLTVGPGTNTIALPSAPDHTFTSVGMVTVNPTSGTNFTITAPVPTFTDNGGPVNISGTYPNYIVNSPATPTVTGAGIVTVSPGPNHIVSIPTPTLNFNPNTGDLASNFSTVNITPGVTYTNNILTVGPSGNSVTISTYTAGTGINFSGTGPVYTISTPGYSLSSPSPTVIQLTNGVATSTLSRTTFTAANGLSIIGSHPSFTVSANNTGTNAVWNTLGNAGTNTVTNFIGTTDARNLVFRTNNNPAVTIFTTGNLAMGTNNPVPDSRMHLLSTTQNVLITMDGVSQSLLRSNVAGVTKGYVGYINQGATGMGFMDNTGTFARFLVTDIGRVGIGTTSPSASLHVAGSSRFVDGNQAAGKVMTSDALGNATWQQPLTDFWKLTGNAGTNPSTNYIGTSDNQPLVFRTNGAENLRLTSAGDVGIGTQAPAAKLDLVSGSFAFLRMATTHPNSNVNVDALPTGAGNLQLSVGGNTGNGFLLRTNSSDRLFVGGNGHIGISTTAPTATLHVNGTTRLTDGTEGAGKVLTSDAQGNASWQVPGGGPTGMVIAFAGTTVPGGFLVCDGSAVSRSTYANLFSIIGTAWGQGDGVSTFNLPDMRGMFLRGVNGTASNDPDTLTRTAQATGGHTGNKVGSVQSDAFQAHGHQFESHTGATVNELNWYESESGNVGMTSGGSQTAVGDFEIKLPKQTTGYSVPRFRDETRPKNVYVYYIIKI